MKFSGSVGFRLRRLMPFLVATAAIAALSVYLVVASSSSSVNHQASGNGHIEQSAAPPAPGGPPGDAGPNWSPDVDPLTGGKEASRSQAFSRAGNNMYRPNVALASDSSVAHAWVASQGPDEGMQPSTSQTAVAFSYRSGVVVSYIPWEYGAAAPPFSQAEVLAHYQLLAAQGPQGAITTETIDGVPALVIGQNFQGQFNPGSIEVELGTSNSNAVTVTIFGRYDLTDLENVADSIVSQWQTHQG